MHLKSLQIKNFRALQDFQVSKLGRINLIVGKNNSGKSSVLEALRIYAGHAQHALLEELAQSHDEKWRQNRAQFETEDDLPFKSFFSGRKFPETEGQGIEIGDGTSKNSVKIEYALYLEEHSFEQDVDGDDIIRTRRKRIFKNDLAALEALQEDNDNTVDETIMIQVNDENPSRLRFDEPRRNRMFFATTRAKPCSFIPTQMISIDELADEWDKIGLTDAQEFVKNALRIVSADFEDILFISTNDGSIFQRSSSRSAIVKLKGETEPVPLNSMGDGILRVLQLFLKLFAAKGGFLLVDEFENGLHYSVQARVWELVFDLAEQLDIQVFATTHSWDCIESFAKVAVEKTATEGVLFRVGRSVRTSDQGRVIATVFDEQKLFNITQSDVEVR